MSAGASQRSKDTKPELALRRALKRLGLHGYRVQHRIELPVWGGKRQRTTPDVAYVKDKLAIYVNGCYWHLCVQCGFRDTKTNTAAWRKKRTDNRARDQRHHRALQTLGWRTLIVWEHDDPDRAARAVESLLSHNEPGIYAVP